MHDEANETQALFEQAQAVGHVGVWTSGIEMDEPLRWSSECYRIFGVEMGLPVQVDDFFAHVHPEDRERVRQASAAAIDQDAPFEIEHRVVREDGTVRWVIEKAKVVRDASGHALRMIGVVQDVTERVEAMEQLHQTQKLEAIGSLAGGIAHDFNNLMSVVLLCSSQLLGHLREGEDLHGYALEIRTAGERAAALTRHLLAFSRRQVLRPAVIDENELLDDMERMLRRMLGEDVELSLVKGDALGCVRVDPSQLEQVVMNLVVNAREAMPNGGKLKVSTSNVTLSDGVVDGLPAGPYVLLEVSDTGHGMDCATRARLFEPFFTTKRDGTGLGLSTAFGIVKQSGGHVSAASAPGRGATFSVYLPRVDGPPDQACSRASGDGVIGTGVVLLVEDEPAVRRATATVLRDGGYTVLEASGPGDALLLSEQHDGRIDLLLTDVIMPRMTGVELARRLARARDDMRVLYMSGYGGAAGMGRTEALVLKPVDAEVLLGRVRQVLDGA